MNNTEYNKQIVEQFPFLLPRNRFTDQVVEDYDYSYTELDSMPDGWRKAFGVQMCQEIAEELKKYNALDKYRILEIKEKYGTLRWYDDRTTDKITKEIIPKYENMSAQICIYCGEKANYTVGYIPMCHLCYTEVFKDGL